MINRLFGVIFFGFWGVIESGCFISKKNSVIPVQDTSRHSIIPEEIIQGELSFGGTSSAFIDKESIDAMIYLGVPDMRACYQKELKGTWNTPPEGKIVIRFTITSDGDIKNIGIESSEINSQRMEDCLIHVFQGFEYNNLTEAEFTLSYPFIFHSEPTSELVSRRKR